MVPNSLAVSCQSLMLLRSLHVILSKVMHKVWIGVAWYH